MIVKRIVSAGAAALATCAVLGMASPAVRASSAQGPDWTQRSPAAHPTARVSPAMAYDKATGTVVLFGGYSGQAPSGHYLGDTWTWNGKTWTRQSPATSPPARADAVMAYDAATGTVVLFGGNSTHGQLDDTWTWNGKAWTRQHPATSPPHRGLAVMAYDAATGTAVLFGRQAGLSGRALADTWTWNGKTWTRQHPATSPPARWEGAMAYDAASGTTVLFGGNSQTTYFSDTWTWNGKTWIRQHPASPSARSSGSAIAYDAASGTVVLFGGNPPGPNLGDTWTWNGRTWTRQHPKTSPPARDQTAMAYDAATRTVVLFGGFAGLGVGELGDTWTWG